MQRNKKNVYLPDKAIREKSLKEVLIKYLIKNLIDEQISL